MKMNLVRTMICAVTVGCALSSAPKVMAATEMDKTFLMNASESDMTEIKLSQLALEKSSNAQVKAYAQKMVTDHNMLSMKMKPYAEQWGVTPATALNAEHQAEYDKLNGLSGADFDKEYISAMSMSHHIALDMFKSEASSTTETRFKKTVMDGEKVVSMHTMMADKMAKKMGVTTSPMSM